MRYPIEHNATIYAAAARESAREAIRTGFWLLILTWGDPDLLGVLVSLVGSWS